MLTSDIFLINCDIIYDRTWINICIIECIEALNHLLPLLIYLTEMLVIDMLVINSLMHLPLGSWELWKLNTAIKNEWAQ